MSNADYSKMTDEEFDAILLELVEKMSAAEILSYGDVNTILREELNNDVLSEWGERNPKKAFPNENEDDGGENEG
jgi:hypothetical protein